MIDLYFFCPDCQREFEAERALELGGMCDECGAVLTNPGSQTKGSPISSDPAPGANGTTPSGNAASQEQGTSQGSFDASAHQDDIVTLQVIPVKDEKRDIASITQLLNSLADMPPISFEIVGTNMQRMLLIRCKRQYTGIVKGRIVGIYGNTEIRELSPDSNPLTGLDHCAYRGAAQLTLAKPAGLPLRTYRELEENDTILPILSALYDLGKDEIGVAQLVIHGQAPEDWAKPLTNELLAIKRRQRGVVTGGQILRLLSLLLGVLAAAAAACSYSFSAWKQLAWLSVLAVPLLLFGISYYRSSGLAWSESLEELVMRKIQMSAYMAEIRLFAGATSPGKTSQILSSLVSSYRVFGMEAGNSLVLSKGQTRAPHSVLRLDPNQVSTFILGDEEIATLWHLPVADLPDMLQSNRVSHTQPDVVEVSRPDGGWYIGESTKAAGRPAKIHLPQATIRSAHALMIGRTGVGKSGTLHRIFPELARDRERSIVVVDPHDDLVHDLLGLVPEDRIEDVYYLNFADPDFRVSINPLDVSLFDGDAERTAEAFREGMHSQFRRYWGKRMQVPFMRGVTALTFANSMRRPDEQFTVRDIITLLNMEDDARMQFLNAVLPDGVVTDTLLHYFNTEYSQFHSRFRQEIIQPVLSKLRAFEENSYLISIFGHSECSVNLVQAVLSGKIILVRTGKTKLSKEFSDFLGSYVLNLTTRALFTQADTPMADRRKVTIITEEAQNFNGYDHAGNFAEVRKFGGNNILTTQGLSTVGRSTASDEMDDPDAMSKIIDNVDTLMVFRMSGENAVHLSKTEFWNEVTPSDLIYLERFQAFIRYEVGRRLVGPFRVDIEAPPKPSLAIIEQILSGRRDYSLAVEDSLAVARKNVARLEEYILAERAHFTSPGASQAVADRINRLNNIDAVVSDSLSLDAVTENSIGAVLKDLNTPSSSTTAKEASPSMKKAIGTVDEARQDLLFPDEQVTE